MGRFAVSSDSVGCSSTIIEKRHEDRAEPIQLAGFYLAGLLCVTEAVLKLTIEGHWSWLRVLLPLWAVLGHNILYVVVGFVWLFFVPPSSPGEDDITIREDPPQSYKFAAMLCLMLFAHNLLARIEGADERMWGWLGTGQWQLLLLFALLSVMCQLLFWSEVVQVNQVSQGERN